MLVCNLWIIFTQTHNVIKQHLCLDCFFFHHFEPSKSCRWANRSKLKHQNSAYVTCGLSVANTLALGDLVFTNLHFSLLDQSGHWEKDTAMHWEPVVKFLFYTHIGLNALSQFTSGKELLWSMTNPISLTKSYKPIVENVNSQRHVIRFTWFWIYLVQIFSVSYWTV